MLGLLRVPERLETTNDLLNLKLNVLLAGILLVGFQVVKLLEVRGVLEEVKGLLQVLVPLKGAFPDLRLQVRSEVLEVTGVRVQTHLLFKLFTFLYLMLKRA